MDSRHQKIVTNTQYRLSFKDNVTPPLVINIMKELFTFVNDDCRYCIFEAFTVDDNWMGLPSNTRVLYRFDSHKYKYLFSYNDDKDGMVTKELKMILPEVDEDKS